MSINLVSLFVMFCSGVAVATAIDFVRTAMGMIRRPIVRRLSAMIEIVVWAFLGCATFYLLLLLKSGDWRAVDALAQIVGIIVYSLLLRGMIRFIGKVLAKIFLFPFLWIGILFVAVVRKLVRAFMRIYKGMDTMLRLLVKKYKKQISK